MFTSSRAPDFKTVSLASGLVLTLAMGVRHGLGFWLQPISQAHGWTRETFSLAIALQNLCGACSARSQAWRPTASALRA